jgi:hypothetical protein
MYKYEIQKACYFGEKGKRHVYYEAGDDYKSETLQPKSAPSYFKLSSGGEVEDNSLSMSRKEMMAFAKEHDLGLGSSPKSTVLIAAIEEFNTQIALNTQNEAEGEQEAQGVAAAMQVKPAENVPVEVEMTNSED